MNIAYPMYVLAKDCGEVLQFHNLRELQHTLERTDIENGEYLAWDAHGRPLSLETQEPMWICITPLAHADGTLDLRDALLAFADAHSVPRAVLQWDANAIEQCYASIITHMNRKSMRTLFRHIRESASSNKRSPQD